MGSIRIAIVDDHPLFRAGVARSLAEAGEFEIVAEGSSNSDAVQIVDRHRPDILLLDISIPGGGGLDAVQTILDKHQDQKIVMLTVSEAGGDVTRALRGGARGYVLKGVDAESLAQILLGISAGDAYVSPTLSARLLSGREAIAPHSRGSSAEHLDDRQRLILGLVSLGWSNKEIALELNLQEKTIKHQLTRIYAMLDVNNRTEAAMVFRDTGDEPYRRESSRSRA
jgi:two-component system, NarL family, nitrate/nitrite response regulator NarL